MIVNGRDTIAYINLKNLKHNLKAIKSLLKKSHLLSVVKANAYGHGIVEISKVLQEEGVNWFGVATLSEGITLRENRIKENILVLNGPFRDEGEGFAEYGIKAVVFDEEALHILNEGGRKRKVKIPVHIKIDTGMGRLGIKPKDFMRFLSKVKKFPNIEVEGVLSHFAHADLKDMEIIKAQLNLFISTIKGFRGIKHIANSAGTILIPSSHFDMVRTGIALYGIYPSPECSKVIKLKPVMSIKTVVHSIKTLPKGHGISYGHTYVLKKKSKVAVLPIGYGDGFMRANSNKGRVIIRGEFCPIIGTVCMDLTIVDVTHLQNVQKGDEVIILGEENGKSISAEDIANTCSTIPYEVLCLITQRVKREYIY